MLAREKEYLIDLFACDIVQGSVSLAHVLKKKTVDQTFADYLVIKYPSLSLKTACHRIRDIIRKFRKSQVKNA